MALRPPTPAPPALAGPARKAQLVTLLEHLLADICPRDLSFALTDAGFSPDTQGLADYIAWMLRRPVLIEATGPYGTHAIIRITLEPGTGRQVSINSSEPQDGEIPREFVKDLRMRLGRGDRVESSPAVLR